MLVFVIITVEGTKNIDPIGRSNLISKGNFWKMAYCAIILVLILAIPNFTIAILVKIFCFFYHTVIVIVQKIE
jgi:hypothetical protein